MLSQAAPQVGEARGHGPAMRGGWLRAAVAALAHELRIRRDLRAVQALDEHLLADLGLARGGIEAAVRHGRG